MKTKGFTLIELLIVVGVIGLLAAVVVGGFSAARNKAHNTGNVQQVSAFVEALQLYHLAYGVYPTVTSPGVCVGTYEAQDGFSAGTCGNGAFSEDPALVATLEPYINLDALKGDHEVFDYFGSPYRGIIYSSDPPDYVLIGYVLRSTDDCMFVPPGNADIQLNDIGSGNIGCSVTLFR